MNGWLNINKNLGLTSFDIVKKVKKIFGIKKVGHAGTLDPFATGVLPIAIGECTRMIEYITNNKKSYTFTIEFGKETDTLDLEGKIIKESKNLPSIEACQNVCSNFIGEIYQTPPKYSAIKIDGQRAYNLARSGIDFDIQERKIEIFDLKFLSFDEQRSRASYSTICSKGTYIRSLARDISYYIQTLGFIVELRRDSVGKFLIGDSIHIDDICHDHVLSTKKLLDDIPVFDVDEHLIGLVLNGGNVDLTNFISELCTSDIDLVALSNGINIFSFGKVRNKVYFPSKNFPLLA